MLKSQILKLCLIVILTAFVVSGFWYASSRAGYYKVLQVYDGDTIAVDMEGVTEEVRLIGVDTPETKDPRKPVQCYGPEASNFSHLSLDHTRVKLLADPQSTNRDRYNRLLRYVYLPDGSLYNKKLLQTGMARAYTGFLFSKSSEFVNAETLAKQNKTGLWASC